MSRLKRNIKNSVYNVADVVLYPLAFFATIPFFMKQLGEELFGLWMLMNSLIITFQILNMGLGPAIMKFTALYKHKSEEEKLSNIISAGVSYSLLLLFISISAGLIISYFTGRGYLFQLPLQIRETGAIAIVITGCIIGLKFIEQTLLHVFKGIERFDFYFYLNNGIRFLTLIINLVQVSYFKSLTSMLAVSAIVTLSMLLLQFLLLKRLVPTFRMSFQFTSVWSKQLLQFGLFIWIQSLIVIIVFQLDRYIVIANWGPVELGYYALVSTIFVNIHTIITAGASWLIPRIVAQTSAQEQQLQLYRNLRAYVSTTGILLLGLFSFLYSPLFSVWIGAEKLQHIKNYTLLFIALEFFYLLIITPAMFMNYSGRIKTGTAIIYIVSLLNIAGIIIGYSVLQNAEGLIIGLIISTAVAVPVIYMLVNKILFNKPLLHELLFFLLLPSIGCIMLYSENSILKGSLFMLLLLLCRLYFINFEKNKTALLFQ